MNDKTELDYREIGKRIAQIRKANHYTQDQLSEVLDLTPKHISHCEAGTSSLSLPKLYGFCNLFHCSMDYIVWGKSKDTIIESINPSILSILRTGTEDQKNQLKRYLDIYCELIEGQK